MGQHMTTRNSVWLTHAAGALVCAVLLGVGYGFGVAPRIAPGQSPAERAEAIRDAQAEAMLQEAVVQRLEGELERSNNALNDRPVLLRPATEINRRLSALSDLVTSSGLVVTASQTGEISALSHYAFVPIEISGEGKLGDFIAMLGALHSRYPDLSVQSFDVLRVPTGDGRFRLNLNWFVQPPQTAEAS